MKPSRSVRRRLARLGLILGVLVASAAFASDANAQWGRFMGRNGAWVGYGRRAARVAAPRGNSYRRGYNQPYRAPRVYTRPQGYARPRTPFYPMIG